MFKKYLTMALVVLVINLSFGGSAYAVTSKETKETKAAKLAEKVKVGITKLGTGKDARVKVKLKDGTKLKGYLSQINETSFVVTNEVTGVATEVPYPNAKQVTGNNLAKGYKIAIGVAIIFVVFTLLGLRSD